MNPNDQESTRYLIIDGHSLIYTWDYLHKLHKSSKTSARENLIRRLTNYQDITGERVVIVFDGRGPTSESINDEYGIQVFYSKSGTTADQIIERLAGKYSKNKKNHSSIQRQGRFGYLLIFWSRCNISKNTRRIIRAS